MAAHGSCSQPKAMDFVEGAQNNELPKDPLRFRLDLVAID
jgi:hypothetical protein